MQKKRVTIYDIAKALNVSASYISRALNDHASISEKAKEKIKKKAAELNYKHNALAANLRQGGSKLLGVIVPLINQRFFSDTISGIEEICSDKNYSLLICQSHENFAKEVHAVDTLIKQNVEGILISVSSETNSSEHLQNILTHDIQLIQFDRCLDELNSIKVENNNLEISYKVTKNIIESGYDKIAFLGGPNHLSTFKNRKDGFLKAIKEFNLPIPFNFIQEDLLVPENSYKVARELLLLKDPPNAFLTVSDHQSLAILRLANELQINVPNDLAIFGFANEDFTTITNPFLSSVDQKSKELGRQAALAFFAKTNAERVRGEKIEPIIVESEIMVRQSSKKI
ncbi:MAG: LacI family DNA-binding transcriptional regulator [Saprospiraceae bacterium]|nr:LacI family DNA-binding transcriptional regulator [Saprospiraceae bacterium]HMS68970.1 LacI family DNA-binding transcriptional regulator [Saprospiraceae bacterium]